MLIKNHLSAHKSPEWLDERVTPRGKEGAWFSGESLPKERACGPHWGRCWIIGLTWGCEGQPARWMVSPWIAWKWGSKAHGMWHIWAHRRLQKHDVIQMIQPTLPSSWITWAETLDHRKCWMRNRCPSWLTCSAITTPPCFPLLLHEVHMSWSTAETVEEDPPVSCTYCNHSLNLAWGSHCSPAPICSLTYCLPLQLLHLFPMSGGCSPHRACAVSCSQEHQ